MRPSRRQSAGVVSVEFAMLSGLLILLLVGTLGLGLLILSETGLQSIAAQTARCAALGSKLCATPADYAVQLAGQRLFSGVITSSDVSVTSAASCSGASGQYTTVAITSDYWSNLLSFVLPGATVTVSACYPSSG